MGKQTVVIIGISKANSHGGWWRKGKDGAAGLLVSASKGLRMGCGETVTVPLRE
jgi:hypothetical protein